MATLSHRQRLWIGAGAIIPTLILGYLGLRPLHLRWGATAAEVARPMPGDLARVGWTRAITIKAAPTAIWPWLAQWGQGRGGWYSYDWLENLLGFDIHTADHILPEHQQPQVGDPLCMARGVCNNAVFIVEPEQFFGWQSLAPDGTPAWTF
ncbi:MAG TPA: SRPBCC family protein, partial [Anaerolineae bacterium]|nr:SRPBCC family protein [Anaerolineae bacterium]